MIAKKEKLIIDIFNLRRENSKVYDCKSSELVRIDKTIRTLKRELFLLINILKLRIVNVDSEEESIKGYLLDVEKNNLKYIVLNKNEEPMINAIRYWKSLKDLLLGESQ
jgi:hypothetical protein